VESSSTEKSILIPFKAITEQLGEFFVYVVDSESVTTKSLVSKQVNKNIIVKDGFKVGETIVTEGVQNLREGSAMSTARRKMKRN
jgi:membrane fusion protein (multidrug efflux system)